MIPDWLFRVRSFFLKDDRQLLPMWKHQWDADNSKSILELELEYKHFKQSLKEMVQSMIALGYVPASTK
jgi:hypothetical protein